jgi:hypothetical protein
MKRRRRSRRRCLFKHPDPFRVPLKSVAPHCRDPRQLLLPNTTPTAKPAPASAPWPEHQVDLEEYIAGLPSEETP